MADRKRTEELVVITKTYDLILWSCNHTSRFPRQHRFVLNHSNSPWQPTATNESSRKKERDIDELWASQAAVLCERQDTIPLALTGCH